MLDYLHNAGIVFYKKGLFDDQIILDQSWALDAIYTVFQRQDCYRQLQTANGRFTRSLLASLAWRDKKYTVKEQELFLSLMESCGVCFQINKRVKDRDNESQYVAPDLLPSKSDIQKELVGRWDESVETVERRWTYSFLSPSLVRRVIATIGNQAGETAVYWKYGVWTWEANTRSAAIVEQEMTSDRAGAIVLSCQGNQAVELLERMSKLILDEYRSTGLPDPVVSGHPIRTDKNQILESKVESDSKDVQEKGGLTFDDPPRPKGHKMACVSYAWKEERNNAPTRGMKVEKFCSRLASKGYEVVRDTEELKLGDRLSEFMRRIGQSDRIYVFLSDAYLKSPNCMFELLTIWQSSGFDAEKFLGRIRVLPMPETDIFSIPNRLKFAGHWKQQRDSIKQAIDEHGAEILGTTDFQNWKYINEFAHHVNEMLAQIADVLLPSNFDEFMKNAEKEFGEEI